MSKTEKRLKKMIEDKIDEMTWFVDYVAEDLDAVAGRGYVGALEWVLDMYDVLKEV